LVVREKVAVGEEEDNREKEGANNLARDGEDVAGWRRMRRGLELMVGLQSLWVLRVEDQRLRGRSEAAAGE
jgi:hypothetical protein